MAYPRTERRPASLTSDADLTRLQRQLAAARSALEADRGSLNRVLSTTEAAQAEVLDCLETYVDALVSRGVPIPPNLRDELRLRRNLRRGRDSG